MAKLKYYRNLMEVGYGDLDTGFSEDYLNERYGRARKAGRGFIHWTRGSDLYIATEGEVAFLRGDGRAGDGAGHTQV